MPPSASPSSDAVAALDAAPGASSSAILNFYRGANVLLTGATGFLGKLLLEKLLRTCPDIGTIYILVRSKKGQAPHQRAEAIFDDPLFGLLKEKNPQYRQHVVPLVGDVSQPKLGLSQEDRATVTNNVNIIFHGAATVRFDEHLRVAVDINVKGTASMLDLAKETKNLKVIMQVSTAYANCNRSEIKECFYDMPMEADRVIQLVDAASDDMLEAITPKVIGTWPNSYSFTKALGENVVRHNSGNLPIGVFRPAIVISTAKEPVAGWIDNLYGPTGVVLGTGLGLLHTLQAYDDVEADMVPGDMVVNSLIAAAWETGSMTAAERESSGVPIYNFVSSNERPVTWREFMDMTIKHGEGMPSVQAVWMVSLSLVKSRFVFLMLTAFLHFLPALFVDAACIIINSPFRLTKVYKKIYKFSNVITYFCTRKWVFSNDRVRALWQKLDKNEQTTFHFNMKDLDWNTYFYDYIVGCRLYLFKEDPKSIPAAIEKRRRLNWLHQGVKILFMFLALRVGWSLLLLALSCLPLVAVGTGSGLGQGVSRSTLVGALRHLGIMPTS